MMSGPTWEGQVIGSRNDGFGVLTFAKPGERFEGEVSPAGTGADLLFGVQYFPSGERYEGPMRGTHRQGIGVLIFPDGTEAAGEFVADQLNGVGSTRHPNGARFEGEIVDGSWQGYGIAYLANGGRYEGEFKSGKPNGAGVLFAAGGGIHQGIWEEGTLKAGFGGAPLHSTSDTPPAASKVPSAATWGTGFVVTESGHVLTNEHVVRDCQRVRIRRPGGTLAPAVLAGKDAANDLALLKADALAGPAAAFRTTKPIRTGEAVVVYGFPLPQELTSTGNLTLGHVTALAGPRDDSRMLQLTAPIQPGNSGGPLLDSGGNVIGVITSTLNVRKVAEASGGTVPQNVNFAIKTSLVTNFLEAHGVRYRSAGAGPELSAADVGDEAREFTVQVQCVR